MIKVDIEESEKKEDGFPKLMRDKVNSSVVLVISDCRQVLVISGPGRELGYDYTYPMDRLEDFHGEITLRNE